MAIKKKDTHTVERRGFRCEFIYSNRSEFDCNVYNGDTLVSELSYPRRQGESAFGAAMSFGEEAAAIAEREVGKGMGEKQ